MVSTPVTLPQMGESVTEGTIIRWLKEEGDEVSEDEPLVEISTDKIDTELPSPVSGVLSKIKVGPDETVEVGAELAVIEESSSGNGAKPKAVEKGAEEKPDQKAEEKAEEKPKKPEAKAEKPKEKPKAKPEKPKAKEQAPETDEEPERAPRDGAAPAGKATSPLVRKLARELDLDVSSITGSGPGGRITKDDVYAAARGGRAPSRAPAAARAHEPSRYDVPGEEHTDVSFDRVRTAIAEHMVRSRATAAHVTDVIEVDMTAIAELRDHAKEGFKRREGTSLTFMPFIASSVVQALRSYPEFNAHVLDDGKTARLFRGVNLGVAVGRDQGLIVPVVHGAEALNLTGLARAIADVGERARTKGGLTPDDVTGGTFTLTNYGSFGALMDTPIIHLPQVAILGIGAVLKRPAVVSLDGVDAIAVRHLMMLSLSYDHRWIDGHQAARFNARLKQLLETTDFSGEFGL